MPYQTSNKRRFCIAEWKIAFWGLQKISLTNKTLALYILHYYTNDLLKYFIEWVLALNLQNAAIFSAIKAVTHRIRNTFKNAEGQALCFTKGDKKRQNGVAWRLSERSFKKRDQAQLWKNNRWNPKDILNPLHCKQRRELNSGNQVTAIKQAWSSGINRLAHGNGFVSSTGQWAWKTVSCHILSNLTTFNTSRIFLKLNAIIICSQHTKYSIKRSDSVPWRSDARARRKVTGPFGCDKLEEGSINFYWSPWTGGLWCSVKVMSY